MKPKIAFLTGGYSSEAEISYQSAQTIESQIDRDKFDCYKIDITPTGWFYEDIDGSKIPVDKNDFSIAAQGGKILFDAAFIGIHGTPGEDGTLQGYLDIIGLPYTSCDMATSALTFNKRNTVAVASMAGIPVSKSVLLLKGENQRSDQEIIQDLTFPIFIKPNNGGSSIGMSKVNKLSESLGLSIAKAFKEDDQVLVEEYIQGREFSVGVYKTNGVIKVLPITEVVTEKEFFDYEAKYKGVSQEITPAQIDKAVVTQLNESAELIYKTFNCSGIIRIDFIYHAIKKIPVMLEINTIPGQSEASIVPKQIKAAGGNLKDFYTLLIEECLPIKNS